MPFSLISLPSAVTTALVEPALIYLILIPLIGILVILFTNFDKLKKFSIITPLIIKQNSDTVLYNIALFFSLLNLLISVIMWYYFNNGASVAVAEQIELGTQFQFIFEINQFSFGVDGISIFFVLLTTFITPIAIFSSYELYVSSKTNNSSDTILIILYLKLRKLVCLWNDASRNEATYLDPVIVKQKLIKKKKKESSHKRIQEEKGKRNMN